MKNIILFHALGDSPDGHWQPWLKKQLEAHKNVQVFTPKFPTPEGQSYAAWKTVFKEYEKYINEETIMVGRSLGCPFILSYLNETGKKINKAILLAPFDRALGVKEIDGINKTFLPETQLWDYKKLQASCKSGYLIYAGDNDPYIPMVVMKEMANNLKAKIITVKNGGHFNKDAGYTKFELLYNEIKNIIK